MTKTNADEISNFESMAADWWNMDGASKPLHKLNPVRIQYIEQQIKSHFQCDTLNGLSILDVGCGGGLVCEPLAQLGANVTGIDAGQKAIDVAKNHAMESNLNITYKCETSHDHKADEKYDVILALEIIEHLDDVADFISSLMPHLQQNGLIIFSTLNRTSKSFALGIVAAEYIVRWVPRGTHDWKKFVKPSELARHVESNDMSIKDITGLIYNPFLDQFSLSKTDIAVNYFMSASHKK